MAKTRLQTAGGSVTTYVADAHDHAALEQLFDEMPQVDHLVSMVGDVMGGGFVTAPMAVIRHVIESKFFTNVRIGQLAAKKIRPGGSLIFTSGTGGRAQDACASYVGNLGDQCVSGRAGGGVSAGHSRQCGFAHRTVTPFWRDMPAEQLAATADRFANAIPLQRTAEIDELAQAYLFLMKNGFITGQHIAVDGGIMLGG